MVEFNSFVFSLSYSIQNMKRNKSKSKSSYKSSSRIGASCQNNSSTRPSSGLNSFNSRKISETKSFEASNVMGRPKLCAQMEKMNTISGPIKVNSVKEMKAHKYGIKSKVKWATDSICMANGPDHRPMIVKILQLRQCTVRYKLTMERYSLKIMRFIGQKPLFHTFPIIYEIFLVSNQTYYIYMSASGERSLYKLITDKHSTIDSEKVRTWLHQLTESVNVIQKYGIAHRFLKLRHLLLDDDDKNIKIVGWSKSVLFWDPKKKKVLYQNKERKSRKNNFLPPEAFHRLYDPSKADVWALGIVLVALSTRRYPFHVRAKNKFSTQWRAFVRKHPMNPIVRSLCNRIFVIDSKKRIHAREMLLHDYFKVMNKQLLSSSVRGKPLKKQNKSKMKKKSKKDKDNKKTKPKSISKFHKAHHSTKEPLSVSSIGASKAGKSSSLSIGSKLKSKSTSKSKRDMSRSIIGGSKTSNTRWTTQSTVGGSSGSLKSRKSSTSKSLSVTSYRTSSQNSKQHESKSTASKSMIGGSNSSSSSASSSHGSKNKSSNSEASSSERKSSKHTEKMNGEKDGDESGKNGSKNDDGNNNNNDDVDDDDVSKQEEEAENDDAKAEANQAEEEKNEPEIDEVADPPGEQTVGEDGEVPVDNEDEGVADEQEMAAPEESELMATPAEKDADEGQMDDVDANSTNDIAKSIIGIETKTSKTKLKK